MRKSFVRAILAKRLWQTGCGTALLSAALCGPALLSAALCGPARAQVYQPPPPPLTSAPCVPTKKDPCAQPNVTPATPATAQRFPFPGETPAAVTKDGQPAPAGAPAGSNAAGPGAAPSFPFPGEPPADHQPGEAGSAGDAGQAHPFPGEPADPGSSSSSSSSSSGSDSAEPEPVPGQPTLHDNGSSGSTRFERKHLPRVEDKDTREEQDLQVSKYYASTGDYKAAYLRAKDAIATIPDDPEGHFLLADAARHYNKPEEAKAEFQTYLQLDPDGDHVKAAQKALAELTPK